MQKLRISFLAAVVAPIVASFSCGGGDNPATTPGGSKEAGTSGSSSGTGGSNSSAGTAGNTMGMAGTAGTMGMGMPPRFNFPDGGLVFKGCCDKTGVCGFAIQATQFNFSTCVTPAEATMMSGGVPQNETVVLDPTCPDTKFTIPDGGVRGGFRPDGGGQRSFDAGPTKSCNYTGPKD